MKTSVSTDELTAGGWVHYASDWYYYSPSWGSTTHIHVGGSNKGGTLQVAFISFKVKDRFAAKMYDAERMISDQSVLEDDTKIPYDVAIEFRRALKPFF